MEKDFRFIIFCIHNMEGTYYHKGNYDKASTRYEKAVKLKPDLVLAYYNMGKAYQYYSG